MKTDVIQRLLLWLLVVPHVAVAASSKANGAGAAANELPKTHTLFMGTDLSIEKDKKFHRVKEVDGSAFVILQNGRPEFIPGNRSGLNLKIEQALKLTPMGATVGNLSSVRAYSPNNDPQRKWVKSQSETSMMIQEQAAVAQDRFMKSELLGNTGFNPYASTSKSNPLTPGEEYELSRRMSGSTFNDPGATVRRAHNEAAMENFDAIEVEFEVSAPRPLHQPYVVVIARYREPSAPTGASRNWIYAKSLEPVDSKPRKVRIFEAGFPFGFILEDCQVHLYNVGQEVATNVSPKRVELTKDEAFQYLLIDYLSTHKGATLPAAPAVAKLPADTPGRLTGGQGSRQLYVRVSKDGEPMGVFVDKDCATKLEDPYIESLVRDIRFKPALDKGRPVEGVAKFKLQDLLETF